MAGRVCWDSPGNRVQDRLVFCLNATIAIGKGSMILSTITGDAKQVTIRLGVRLDASMHQAFRDAYRGMPRSANYCLDFRETDFMDSSALGMLLLLREYVQEYNSSITLRCCHEGIKQQLLECNFDKLFHIE